MSTASSLARSTGRSLGQLVAEFGIYHRTGADHWEQRGIWRQANREKTTKQDLPRGVAALQKRRNPLLS